MICLTQVGNIPTSMHLSSGRSSLFPKLLNHHLILSHSRAPEKVRLGLGQDPLPLQVYKLEKTPSLGVEYKI